MAALVVGIVVAVIAGDGDEPQATTPPTATPATPATPAPPPTTAPGTTRSGPGTTAPPATTAPSGATGGARTALDRAVDEGIAFVESARGLKFKTRPVVVALDDAAFIARLEQLVDEDARKNASDYEVSTGLMQALDILPAGVTALDATRTLVRGGVLGYYDPESKELRVRAGSITPLARTTIVHELVHALDDQWFDLDRPEYDELDDERSFALSALAEGSARAVENAYRASMSRADRAEADAEELRLGAGVDLSSLTQAYIALTLAPYEYGETLVDTLVAQGGQEAVNRAFGEVPTTSEQVMDPARYARREAAVAVAAPPADGPVVDDGVVGQIVIESFLGPVVGRSVATRAAAGWGGDKYVAWRSGNRMCLRIRFEMESTRDGGELRDALTTFARRRGAGTTVSGSGSGAELTSCSR